MPDENETFGKIEVRGIPAPWVFYRWTDGGLTELQRGPRRSDLSLQVPPGVYQFHVKRQGIRVLRLTDDLVWLHRGPQGWLPFEDQG